MREPSIDVWPTWPCSVSDELSMGFKNDGIFGEDWLNESEHCAAGALGGEALACLSMLFCALFFELDLAPKKETESRSSAAEAAASLRAAGATVTVGFFLPSMMSICGAEFERGVG